MSSQLYSDKDIEELRPILERYIDKHKTLFGHAPSMQKLHDDLFKLQKESEEKLFNSMFAHLTPIDLSKLCAETKTKKAKQGN